MPLYSEDVLDEVRRHNDIVEVVSSYVPLRQRGGRYLGICPFHREKTPSFNVGPDTQMFYCFGCHAGGNVIGFVMRIENLVFVDAVKRLAERARIELPDDKADTGGMARLREAIYEANAKAARFYFNCLAQDMGKKARDYLLERRVKNSVVQKFGLGFAPFEWDELHKHLKAQDLDDNVLERSWLIGAGKRGFVDKFRGRLMFPIIDARDRVSGFGGRAFGDDNVKYINTGDTPVFSKQRNLFGLNFARKTKHREVIVVEGYMDVLALHQAGFDNAIAALGTAMGREHARAINQYFRGKTAVLLFDSDSAGEAALLRAIPILRREGVNVKVMRLNESKDPDEFLVKYGKEAFERTLERAAHPTEFQLGLLRANRSDNDEGMVAYVNDAAALLGTLSDPAERDVYMNALARETGVSPEALRGKIERSTENALISYSPAPRARRAHGLAPGLMSAYRNVLYWLATHIILYESLRDAFNSDEILFPAYAKLCDVIRGRREAKDGVKTVSPADLVNDFEDATDQESVAAVFQDVIVFENDDMLKTALNQQLKIIKTAYINSLLDELRHKSNEKMLNELGESLRKLPDSYI